MFRVEKHKEATGGQRQFDWLCSTNAKGHTVPTRALNWSRERRSFVCVWSQNTNLVEILFR
jgi:hypothetical protein